MTRSQLQVAGILALLAPIPVGSQTTAQYDNARTGAAIHETILTSRRTMVGSSATTRKR